MAEEPEKRFTLTFSMESDAFNTGSPASEIMRILGEVTGAVAVGRFSGTVVDVNGNTVGTWLTVWREDPTIIGRDSFGRNRRKR
jgi:hypothetical protein